MLGVVDHEQAFESGERGAQRRLGAVEAQDKLTPEVMARIAKVLDNEPVRPLF